MKSSRFHSRQTGAALLVSLIILLVLSIIGISAMRGGLLQTLISSNSQQAEMAFSAADGGISAVVYTANQDGVSTGGILANATAAGVDAINPYAVQSDGAVAALVDDAPNFDDGRETPITTVTANLIYRDCVNSCPGYSAKLNSTGGAGCHVFEINSTGTVAETQTQVDQWVNVVSTPCVD